MYSDVLMTEKYISGTYDTVIFEFRDTNTRDVLNHIQKEEQKLRVKTDLQIQTFPYLGSDEHLNRAFSPVSGI